jgi:hypothetical protein
MQAVLRLVPRITSTHGMLVPVDDVQALDRVPVKEHLTLHGLILSYKHCPPEIIPFAR